MIADERFGNIYPDRHLMSTGDDISLYLGKGSFYPFWKGTQR
jgi:hypothetical protein